MKITKRQLRRIIKEERTILLKEYGDPVADKLLGSFLNDMVYQLMGMYEKEDAHRLGSEEEFEQSVETIAVEVEDLVRKRLGDLWSGDLRLELIG
tara:strand:+ start:1440 stop:1724 length:285 start_codon:yes stop_codon:yes gene_type:complete